MMRRWSVLSVIGSVALLLLAGDFAQAQSLRSRLSSMRERRMERRDMRLGIVTTRQMTPASTPSMSNVRVSNYYTPANEGLAKVAKIRVLLPDAQARLLFDAAATKQTGAERMFVTPELTGTGTGYRIRAVFMQGNREVTRERVLTVAPGMTYVVDFSRR